jgi:hypothetical protein
MQYANTLQFEYGHKIGNSARRNSVLADTHVHMIISCICVTRKEQC